MVNVLSSRTICVSRKGILFCFSFSAVNDLLAASRPFAKFWEASKVSKPKVINIPPVVMRLKVQMDHSVANSFQRIQEKH